MDTVLFWGIADRSVAEVVDFFPSAAEALAALDGVLGDEPDWLPLLDVVAVELGDDCPN